MADKVLTFYLHDRPEEETPLQADDLIILDDKGMGCVCRQGHTLFCDKDGETSVFPMHSTHHPSPVHYALFLAESYRLTPRIRRPEVGGEKEWVLEKLAR